MASTARGPSPHLKTGLLEKGHRYAFAQALRLLRRVVAQEGGGRDGRGLWRRVKVRPSLSFGFAPSDILSITETEPSRYCMTVAFLGLYGTSSPLPNFYTEDLLDEQGTHRTVTRDFLDVLNGAVYPLFFQSWAKHRLFHALIEGEDAGALERLYCLLGLPPSSRAFRALDPFALLTYLGLFGLATRPAEGLRALLADHFGEPSFQVVPCVERTVPIPAGQRCRLGEAGHQLGEDACLGTTLQDRMGMFRVELGPLGPDAAQRFIPGGDASLELAELVRLYCRDSLAWELRLQVRGAGTLGTRLGSPAWSSLGRDAWLPSSGSGSTLTVLTFPGDRATPRPRPPLPGASA